MPRVWALEQVATCGGHALQSRWILLQSSPEEWLRAGYRCACRFKIYRYVFDREMKPGRR